MVARGTGGLRKRRPSRLVGPATHDGGTRTTAYEALVALACGVCGRAIAPGEVFTRHSQRAVPGPLLHVPTQVPVCTACRPMQVAPRT